MLIAKKGETIMNTILQTKNLKKYYGRQSNVTRALDGIEGSSNGLQ